MSSLTYCHPSQELKPQNKELTTRLDESTESKNHEHPRAANCALRIDQGRKSIVFNNQKPYGYEPSIK